MQLRELPGGPPGPGGFEALPDPAGKLLAHMLDSLFAFVGLLEPDGTLVYANRAALDSAAIGAAEVQGRRFWDCYWWSYDDDVRARLREACARAAAGNPVRYEAVVRMAHDSRMVIDFKLSPLRDASGAVQYLVPSGVDISERKRVEEDLRRSEELVRTIAENSTQGLAMMDEGGYCIYANRAWLTMTGYTAEEIRSAPLHDLVHHHRPDGRPYPKEECPIDRALPENFDVRAHEDLFFRKDGSTFPVLCAASPIFKDGKPVSTVIEIRDTTEAKRAEAAVREREKLAGEAAQRAENERAMLDAVLEAAPAGIILADREGRLLRYNKANERLWGKAPLSGSVEEYAEWKGWWADGSERHGRRVQPHEWAMARALEGETVPEQIADIEPFDAPGVRRTMLNSGAPVRAADGSILGAVVAQMDITALLQAQQAQRDLEAQFRALADHIPQLAWMMDPSGWICWYNQRWFAYTGTALEQMQGWGWKAVHHPEHVGRVEQKLRAHVISGEPWEDTFPLRGRDGSYRWFLSRAIPLRDGAGRIERWFGTNTDITEQLRAEQQLREADRRKDEFIATLAHELRNPLAPVRNAVEILGRIPSADPKIERMRAIIDRQVAHMTRLIDDLLDVARIARGKLELQLQDCDLCRIATQTAEDYRATMDGAGITMEVHGAGAPLPVRGDPVRLAQAVGNYLQNATRFARGGHVSVECLVDLQQGEAVVRVADNGTGIPAALLPQLFTSFAQADQGLARSSGGLGLGLALTRGIAELHGGRVHAASAGEGRGASFELRIPLLREPLREGAMPGPAGPPARSLRILVIEDSPDSAETLHDLLEAEGHEVEVAGDGTTGVQRAQAWRPDLVICDIGLPGEVDGYVVGRALQSSPKTRDIRLVALSGYADREARASSRNSGYAEHLAKPVDFELLRQCIARLSVADPGRGSGGTGAPPP